MLLRLAYLGITNAFALLRLLPDSDGDKDAEILAQAVSRSTVATATGRRAHPTMQWHALVGSVDYLNMTGSLWPGSNPARGQLAPSTLATLCEIGSRRGTVLNKY
jgi:hypothetical protein